MHKNSQVSGRRRRTDGPTMLPQNNSLLELSKWSGTVLGAIALGATTGISFGPIGTAIGGILGAVGGATVIVVDSQSHKNNPR